MKHYDDIDYFGIAFYPFEECETMTIDETGTEVETMNELVVTEQVRPVLNTENMSMIRTALAAISNTLVDASQLAQDFARLEAEVETMRKEMQRSNDLREVAIHAYEQVNGQRIAAESELTTVRFERDAAKSDKDQLQFDVQGLNAKLAEANGRIAALEEDQSKLLGEMDKAIDDVKVEWSTKLAQAKAHYDERMETMGGIIRDRDATIAELRSKLDVSERDNRTLRQMLDEARKALGASMAVLSGELAAE